MPNLRIGTGVGCCSLGTITRLLAAAGALLLTVALALLFLMSVRLDVETDLDVPGPQAGEVPSLPADPENPADLPPTTYVMRPGLFKSGNAVQDKPMADKTIEKIRSQLRLQCVMQINGEPVAYVNIKNMGVRRCRVGESVADLFTVLNIHNKSIEISIVDHRVTLDL